MVENISPKSWLGITGLQVQKKRLPSFKLVQTKGPYPKVTEVSCRTRGQKAQSVLTTTYSQDLKRYQKVQKYVLLCSLHICFIICPFHAFGFFSFGKSLTHRWAPTSGARHFSVQAPHHVARSQLNILRRQDLIGPA